MQRLSFNLAEGQLSNVSNNCFQIDVSSSNALIFLDVHIVMNMFEECIVPYPRYLK